MKKLISGIRRKFSNIETKTIERAFIAAYGRQHNLRFDRTYVIKDFLSEGDFDGVEKYITSKKQLTCLDELVTAFECLLSDGEKKNKGVVYTPAVIRDYISKEVIQKNKNVRIVDPACGCGAFLISAAILLNTTFDISYAEIFKNNLWGCDIDPHSIEKCKMLLELLALQEEGAVEQYDYHLLTGNALELLAKAEHKGKYDVIIGNPPYVRAKNIDDSVRDSLDNWSVVSGNIDLYIPFYQLGVELLTANGKLGYISPNTYLQSVNGRGLRNYLRKNKYNIRIINFKDAQKFIDVTHYTCITFIDKNNRQSIVEYAVCDDNLNTCVFTSYNIANYTENAEWRFGNQEVDRIVFSIEHQPDKLDNYNIRNGLATLCNDLFFFKAVNENEKYYFRTYKGKEYKIEKDLCISIAKPNIMRNESDLKEKGEKAIYPYRDGTIIAEPYFESQYPYAYHFLAEYKSVLLDRDKGKAEDYPEWYAYGRTQGMRNQGTKILIPYMADRGVAIISRESNLLFYCGYAVFSEDIKKLTLLKILIESDVFWFYIKMTSKPYSKGFMALAKNYIKNFGIPVLTDSEMDTLTALQSEEREKYIADLYDINYATICRYIHTA